MVNPYLILEKHEPGISIIQIYRPETLNALNSELLLQLKAQLVQESQDSKTQVVIITGAGEKAFISGADISEMENKSISEGVQFSQLGHEVTKLLELMPKPTLAAVNGYALGAGTEIAIACDFILASETAIFGQPEVGLGMIPGFGATLRLSKFIGLPRAKELIFSGRPVSAQEALALGLVNHVYPSEELMSRVLETALAMAAQSAPAIARAKQLLNEFSETQGLYFKIDAEAQAFGRLFGSPDQIEGVSAFLEKRKPKFLR